MFRDRWVVESHLEKEKHRTASSHKNRQLDFQSSFFPAFLMLNDWIEERLHRHKNPPPTTTTIFVLWTVVLFPQIFVRRKELWTSSELAILASNNSQESFVLYSWSPCSLNRDYHERTGRCRRLSSSHVGRWMRSALWASCAPLITGLGLSSLKTNSQAITITFTASPGSANSTPWNLIKKIKLRNESQTESVLSTGPSHEVISLQPWTSECHLKNRLLWNAAVWNPCKFCKQQQVCGQDTKAHAEKKVSRSQVSCRLNSRRAIKESHRDLFHMRALLVAKHSFVWKTTDHQSWRLGSKLSVQTPDSFGAPTSPDYQCHRLQFWLHFGAINFRMSCAQTKAQCETKVNKNHKGVNVLSQLVLQMCGFSHEDLWRAACRPNSGVCRYADNIIAWDTFPVRWGINQCHLRPPSSGRLRRRMQMHAPLSRVGVFNLFVELLGKISPFREMPALLAAHTEWQDLYLFLWCLNNASWPAGGVNWLLSFF